MLLSQDEGAQLIKKDCIMLDIMEERYYTFVARDFVVTDIRYVRVRGQRIRAKHTTEVFQAAEENLGYERSWFELSALSALFFWDFLVGMNRRCRPSRRSKLISYQITTHGVSKLMRDEHDIAHRTTRGYHRLPSPRNREHRPLPVQTPTDKAHPKYPSSVPTTQPSPTHRPNTSQSTAATSEPKTLWPKEEPHSVREWNEHGVLNQQTQGQKEEEEQR
ncbi:hypothetical protein DL93DRAFT_2103474 [Clavulina sp. PMI_390]|nr:hypothetical protein DL93DRAFT_2103474 [Clavulina sp. PMI_390]